MRRILGILGLFSFLLIIALGCSQSTTTSGTTTVTVYSPPTGVTSVDAGVSGITVSGNSVSFNYSLINAADNTPIASVGDLGTGNLRINIRLTSEAITQEATITTVSKVTASSASPITVAMTLDRSGSMPDDANVSLEAAAISFINLMGSSDQGAIINFDHRIKVDQGLTSNKSSLISAVSNESTSGGSTALYDSIGVAISTADAGSNTRKAVIAMTDGNENYSNKYTTTTEVVNYANSKSIPVYTVGLGDSIDATVLRAIATATGGIYYAAPTASQLVTLYDSISAALRNYFTVAFTSSTTITVGRQYYVTVELINYGTITKTISFTFTAQ